MNFYASIAVSACVALSSAMSSPSLAQTYPSKAIRLIIPYGGSSGPDPIGRVLAERLQEQMKVPVVVENREGAGGQIGTVATINAVADGHTILLVNYPGYISQPYLQSKPAYDPMQLTSIARIASVPLIVLAANNAPFKSFGEMVAYAKQNPDKLTYGSNAVGSASHLAMETIKLAFGISVKHVPYRSTAQQMTDIMGGQIHMAVASVSGAIGAIQKGDVKALGVGSLKRNPELPDTPTFAELSGKPNLEIGVWYGFFGPPKMPAAIAQRLADEIKVALKSTQSTTMIKNLGAEETYLDPKEMTTEIEKGASGIRTMIQQLKIPLQD